MFLRSLPPSWSQIALIMRNKPDIDQTDIDDLYNNLRVYEDEMKRSSSSTSNSQNLAFLSSEIQSSTKKSSTRHGYGTQLDEMSNKSETDSEISMSVFEVSSSDEKITPANDRQFLFDELRVLMPRVVKSRDEIFSRWGYCDNHDLSRLDNQSIERDRLIGIGFVLNFVKFISFTFGDKEMISVIEAIIREVFVKLLLDSFGKLSISYAFSVSLLLTALCCYDIHDVTPRVSALVGCDILVSEPGYRELVAFATGCKRIKNSKRCNRKIRIPIAMWPCRVEEKMTLKEVNGQTVEEIETKIIAKDGTITRVPGKVQDYETSEEEPVEQPRRHDLYGFVDHLQLQQGNPMNKFAPHRLPQPKGNMNGWLIEDEEEVKRNEVDSDLECTTSSKPVWKKTTNADHDCASRNCPYCSK
ncbi:hypothetical protein Tco_0198743 [Tanacetum coccineum]